MAKYKDEGSANEVKRPPMKQDPAITAQLASAASDAEKARRAMNAVNMARRAASAAALKSRMGMKKGGSVGSASKRADGCAQRGKTKGKFV